MTRWSISSRISEWKKRAAAHLFSAAALPAYVARLLGKRGATIVSPENFMLYTPMLPEAALGTLEPLRVVADWSTALFFPRDIAELGTLGHPERLEG